MSRGGVLLPALSPLMLAIAVLSPGTASWAVVDRCLLPSQHAGVTFPVEQVAVEWTCRLHPIVSHYTTANKVGPIRTTLPHGMYVYLLDHPTMAAMLINRLDLALYRAEAFGSHRYRGNDGEGAEGVLELAYQDRTTRMYYLEGSQDGRVLPHLTGKAVLFLRMTPVKSANGTDAMDTTMVAYTRLDNRMLSGVVSLLRPLVGGTVTRKLVKGVETVNRLSRVMREEPERVLMEAADPPGLPEEEMVWLRAALEALRDPVPAWQKKAAP
jgi:hypothetical protein